MRYTEEYIAELISKFMEGQTTEDEENVLSDYFCSNTDIPAEWGEYKKMFESFKTDAYNFSEEEKNNMLCETPKKRFKLVRYVSWAAAACIAAVMVTLSVFLFNKTAVEDVSLSQNDIAETKQTVVRDTMVNTLEVPDKQEVTTENNVLKQENRQLAEINQNVSSESECITTAELLELMNTLADMTQEDVSITASKTDNKFVINTVSVDGQSNVYAIKKYNDGQSIELISQ